MQGLRTHIVAKTVIQQFILSIGQIIFNIVLIYRIFSHDYCVSSCHEENTMNENYRSGAHLRVQSWEQTTVSGHSKSRSTAIARLLTSNTSETRYCCVGSESEKKLSFARLYSMVKRYVPLRLTIYYQVLHAIDVAINHVADSVIFRFEYLQFQFKSIYIDSSITQWP